MRHLLSLAGISIFSLKISNFGYVMKHRQKLHFDTFFPNSFDFDLLVCFNWHIYNIDDAWKIAAPGYYVITFVYGVTNKTLLCDSNDTVDVLMWLMFVNSSIFMREVIITWFFKDLTKKNDILEWCSWFKFNNLGVVLGMAKWSKLNSPFKEVAGEKNL